MGDQIFSKMGTERATASLKCQNENYEAGFFNNIFFENITIMRHNLSLKITWTGLRYVFHSKEFFFFWAHGNFHDLPHFFFNKLIQLSAFNVLFNPVQMIL